MRLLVRKNIGSEKYFYYGVYFYQPKILGDFCSYSQKYTDVSSQGLDPILSSSITEIPSQVVLRFRYCLRIGFRNFVRRPRLRASGECSHENTKTITSKTAVLMFAGKVDPRLEIIAI